MSESQMIPAARFSCTDQAREWAEIQPDNQTWAQFITAFLQEYGDKNQDQLRMEMLAFQQNDLSVGEYATVMQRFYKQIDGITPEQQVHYFIRNLRLGLREGIFAGQPATLSDAISMARKAEYLFTSFFEKQPEIGREVAQLKKMTADSYLAHKQSHCNSANASASQPASAPQNQSNEKSQGGKLLDGQFLFCPRCDEIGHRPTLVLIRPRILFTLAVTFGRSTGMVAQITPIVSIPRTLCRAKI
jgi:hypothetical protein